MLLTNTDTDTHTDTNADTSIRTCSRGVITWCSQSLCGRAVWCLLSLVTRCRLMFTVVNGAKRDQRHSTMLPKVTKSLQKDGKQLSKSLKRVISFIDVRNTRNLYRMLRVAHLHLFCSCLFYYLCKLLINLHILEHCSILAMVCTS